MKGRTVRRIDYGPAGKVDEQEEADCVTFCEMQGSKSSYLMGDFTDLDRNAFR